MHYLDTKIKAEKIRVFLEENDFNVKLASEHFGMARGSIYRYIKALNLTLPSYELSNDPKTGRFVAKRKTQEETK